MSDHSRRLTGITDGVAWSECGCGHRVEETIPDRPHAGLHAMNRVESAVAEHQDQADEADDEEGA